MTFTFDSSVAGVGTVTFPYTSPAEDGACTASASADITLIDCAEGCTFGYFKNQTDRWCDSYSTYDLYGDVFMDAPEELADLTLLEELNLGGGGIYNLGPQSIAALLTINKQN